MKIFSLLFGAVYYICVFNVDWALFRYYPETGVFARAHDPEQGVAILWYGWMATAALVSIPIALIVPRRVEDRLWNGLLWIVPLLSVAAIFIHESRWFR